MSRKVVANKPPFALHTPISPLFYSLFYIRHTFLTYWYLSFCYSISFYVLQRIQIIRMKRPVAKHLYCKQWHCFANCPNHPDGPAYCRQVQVVLLQMIHILWTATFCMNEGSVENIIFASYPYPPLGPVLCKDNAPIQHFFCKWSGSSRCAVWCKEDNPVRLFL